MKKSILLIISMLIMSSISAQKKDDKEKKFGIKFSGFVKNDVFYDTRETVAAREGHFLLWPANQSLDSNGNDLNEVSSLTMLSIQSRLKGSITGPDAFGAKTSGLIEADFFGSNNDNINSLRLRHAFLKFDWKHSKLLLGQYWNPMFYGICYPTTVSFNSGAGIMPFARNPQIRYTYQNNGLKAIVTAYSERDHASAGIGGISSKYTKNSGLPVLNGQLHYTLDLDESKITAGAGVNYLTTKPQSVTSLSYQTDETLSAITYHGFITAKFKPLTIKVSALMGENMVSTLSYGGFAVLDTLDKKTKSLSYTPVKNGILWADINTNGDKVQFGIFAGINKNMGTRDEINTMTSFYGRMPYIAQVTRVSPRIVFISGKTKFGCELEISSADYGDGTYDKTGIPQNTVSVTNYRLLFGATYLF